MVDHLALSSEVDRNSNYRPEPDTLLFLHSLLSYKLIQTIQRPGMAVNEWSLSCDTEHSAGLFRIHLTVVTNSLAAWEYCMSRIRVSRCFVLLVRFLEYPDSFVNKLLILWAICKMDMSVSSHHAKSAAFQSLLHICLHRVPPLCNGNKRQTALHYVSTTVSCWGLPEPRSRQHSHWIIKFHGLQESQAQDRYESLIVTVCAPVVHVQALNVEQLH